MSPTKETQYLAEEEIGFIDLLIVRAVASTLSGKEPHRHGSAPDHIRTTVGGEMAPGTTVRGDRLPMAPVVFRIIDTSLLAVGEGRHRLNQ